MTATPTPDKKPFKHRKLIIVLSIILVFIITLVSTFFIMVKIGEIRLKKSLVAGESIEDTDQNQEDIVYHNGKEYIYNENLINLLLIGVDKKEETETVQGQADALYLVSIDDETSKVKIVSISRNTVCDFDVIGIDGNAYDSKHKQICLAYAYANNDVESSENCVKAVSDLLYDIPINGYYTIHLKSIQVLVDAIGGVSVTITENDADTSFYNQIGQTIVLDGDTANSYLGIRGNSNGPRVERHKEFIKGFINSVKGSFSSDLTLPFELANKMKEYSVTDINITSGIYLAARAVNWDIEFVNIKGEYSIEDNLEIFTVDEDELKNTVIDNFYIEK